MKHFLLTFFALALCVACSKDDDSGSPSSDIVGTWKPTAFTYDGYWEGIDEIIPVFGQGDGLSVVRVTFNSDGSVSSNGKKFDFFLINKDDETEKMRYQMGLFEDGGTWEKDGNTLSVTDFFGDASDGMTIVELTPTSMHLTASFEQTPGSGQMSSIDIRMTKVD